MSGIIGSRLNVRGSGLVSKLGTDGQVLTSAGAGKQLAFEDVAGGVSWQSVETGSTMTAVAGNGYPIDTTSNACTITLPASASNGDQIVFTDYARNWGTNAITIDSNGLNYQGDDDTWTVKYDTDGQSVNIVYSGSTNGWIPIEDDTVTDAPLVLNSEGIFGFGNDGSRVGYTNLVSNTGVVATDVTAVGTARSAPAACEYGVDKGIFGFGNDGSVCDITNLVSNAGVVATDVTGVGTAKEQLAACSYGGDKGIFGFGYIPGSGYLSATNLVSNAGVVGSDVTGVGTAKYGPAACEYGGDKGIFGFGYTDAHTADTNLVSNAGVVSTDVTGVGTARGENLAACSYGEDKGIFGYGYHDGSLSMTNLVSNTGVVATDTTGVGTARGYLAACEYGGDKGIFGFGYSHTLTSKLSVTNLVSNAGVVATDTAGVGTARENPAACSFN